MAPAPWLAGAGRILEASATICIINRPGPSWIGRKTVGKKLASNESLRAIAEAKLATMPEAAPPPLDGRIAHELQVHQIELEMQNEELRRSLADLDLTRTRYFDLYDLAPVGYCTVSEQGLILQTNLTASSLLGRSRSVLIKQPFSRLILKDDQDSYKLHRKQLLAHGAPLSCDLRMLKLDATPFWVHLSATSVEDDAAPVLRIVITDISVRKQAERELTASKAHLHQLTIFLQRAREDDRSHFARELHDELGQNLTALRIDFNSLAACLATVDPVIVGRLAAIDQMIDSTVDATRRICEELRPGMLDDLGFEAAISSYAKHFTAQFGVPCDLLLDREDYGLDKLLSTALFRIVQESLTNIARHAHASHAMVALHDRGDELLLTIADDGCGMSAELTGERKTYGMLGMRERVDMIGGRIAIDSAPGRGTHIEVSIPRNAEASQ